MSQKPPKNLIGEPLKIKDINDKESMITVEFQGEEFEIPLKNATISTRTPKEVIKV